MRINCGITPVERAKLSQIIDSVNAKRAELNLPPVNQSAVVKDIIHRISEMSMINLCSVFITKQPEQ